jgi:predicted nucleic acid-binding protein
MTSVLLDTNVLCYATDLRDRAKCVAARATIDRLSGTRTGVVSPQVIGEFARATTRPGRGWLTPSEARIVLADTLLALRIVKWTSSVALLALDGMERFGWTYWDAQIWATARASGVRLVLSEDFADRLVADGVGFRNPFAEGFDLEEALRAGAG